MNNKEAKIKYPINNLLSSRWSPRAFEDKKVEKEKIQRFFEAARWTPSASNLQPWSFIFGEKGDETYKKIFECLVEFNQLWAKFAPVLIITVSKKNIKDTTDINGTYAYDLGQSVAHLTFQAMHDGLYVHQMSGFDPQKAREKFEIPENYDAVSVIALGYIGKPEILPERMQKSEKAKRIRKDLDTFIFSGKFGQTSKLI